MPGLSPPPRTRRSHWKHANEGGPGPGVTVVHQREGAAAPEPIQPPDGRRQPRGVFRCRRTEARNATVGSDDQALTSIAIEANDPPSDRPVSGEPVRMVRSARG